MEPNEYITKRLEDQITWYSTKSQYNKGRSIALRILEIVCAAIIPFISVHHESFKYFPLFVGLLGITISIAAGISAILKFHDNWIEYRTVCETLKHEKFLFLTKTNPYDSENAFHQLVIRVEGLISRKLSMG